MVTSKMVASDSSHFADFEQAKIVNYYFADSEQAKIVNCYFADFEQVKKF